MMSLGPFVAAVVMMVCSLGVNTDNGVATLEVQEMGTLEDRYQPTPLPPDEVQRRKGARRSGLQPRKAVRTSARSALDSILARRQGYIASMPDGDKKRAANKKMSHIFRLLSKARSHAQVTNKWLKWLKEKDQKSAKRAKADSLVTVKALRRFHQAYIDGRATVASETRAAQKKMRQTLAGIESAQWMTTKHQHDKLKKQELREKHETRKKKQQKVAIRKQRVHMELQHKAKLDTRSTHRAHVASIRNIASNEPLLQRCRKDSSIQGCEKIVKNDVVQKARAESKHEARQLAHQHESRSKKNFHNQQLSGKLSAQQNLDLLKHMKILEGKSAIPPKHTTMDSWLLTATHGASGSGSSSGSALNPSKQLKREWLETPA